MNTVITSREAILNVSKEMAMRDGIQSLNMRSVAEQCGVSVGSVYNYFPSKADLISATVESVWNVIFRMDSKLVEHNNFIEAVQWIFDSVSQGSKEYPAFFTIHSMSFTSNDKEKGRQTMNQYFGFIKQGMVNCLNKDAFVQKNAFNDVVTKKKFVDFVFSNILSLLMKREKNCDVLIEIIERAIY